MSAFAIKGMSLYLVRTTMIKVGAGIEKEIQHDLTKAIINADTEVLEKKHSGKFIGHLLFDAALIIQLVSTSVLSLVKDSLTLIALLTLMFYQNWKLSLIAIIMIPLASAAVKKLGKRVEKETTQAQEKSGFLTTYLIEIFKNHKLIKIFQKENYENSRAEKFLNALKEKTKKIAIVFVRASPIMEVLTGIMIALLIFYSGKLIVNNELDINNFFSLTLFFIN